MLHYSSQLANALAARPEVELSVILAEGTPTALFSPEIDLRAIQVTSTPELREVMATPYRLLKLPWFLRMVADTRPDVVHLNSSHVWLVLTLRHLRGKYPIAATVHDVHPHPGKDNTLRKRIERRTVMRLAHKIFVHGEAIKQQLLLAVPGRNPEDVVVLPHGDYSFFRRWMGQAEREPRTVLFFGRIREYKGLAGLIEAAPFLRERVPDVRIVVAGEGDLREHRQALADTGLYEVHNRYIPDEEVPKFFERASVAVLPYTEASQSGVVPIANSFHLPVVATRVGALPDAVEEGKTGLLVPPKEPQALAEALARVLLDPALRDRLGEAGNAKQRAEQGWDRIAEKKVEVYREMITART
jgi:glycosyltransferase involved in cell wall biosynthesis